tara:strand:+ start:253 stop:600 length:348 start_codon:yes stop_codon:yes gene_type:complete
MKISKETFRKIIKEEIDKTLAEKFVTDVPRSIERNRTEDDLSPEQKEQLAYLLAKRGETLSTDIAKRNRQINYFIDLISSRGKLGLDITPDYIDDKDDIPAIAESLIDILNLIKG